MIFLHDSDNASSPGDAMTAIEMRIEADGRLVLPPDALRRLGVHPGESVLVDVTDEGILVWTREMAVVALQELVSASVPSGRSLVGELHLMRKDERGGLEPWPLPHSVRRARG